jgi:hypothetical protein
LGARNAQSQKMLENAVEFRTPDARFVVWLAAGAILYQ